MTVDGGSCGCFGSDSENAKSKRIDRELSKERKRMKRQVKVLLLGSGESGKSTFVKQMVIIHGGGEFSGEDQKLYTRLIYQNVVTAMKVLLDAREKLDFTWDESAHEQVAEPLKRLDGVTARNLDYFQFSEYVAAVKELWTDLAIKRTYDARHMFQITDSCKYFFDNIDRVAQPQFVPTNRDILFCRKATRTITEHVFTVQKIPFRFVDVGGQRSQRQKWFQCFEGITSVLFLVASNEYDQVILEDRRTNRVLESRAVFETIVNNRSFANVAVILFLNKTDLLIEKLPVVNFRKYFPEFRGDSNSLPDVQKFLLTLFESSRQSKKDQLYYHYTTAVDTENIRRVFNDCREIILQQNLKLLMMT